MANDVVIAKLIADIQAALAAEPGTITVQLTEVMGEEIDPVIIQG